METPNVASLYCDEPIRRVWSEERMVETEWAWWTAVLELQHCLGAEAVTFEDVQKTKTRLLRRSCTPFDLACINVTEYRTKHDLMARLEHAAGLVEHQHLHLGMTSADVVENVYQIRIRRSLEWLRNRYGIHVEHLADYPLRGVHGPVGTDQDQLDLLGSQQGVQTLNQALARAFGFGSVAQCVPQVMHRSMDLAVLAPVVSEVKGRLGRTPWTGVLGGYLSMLAGIAGDTWNEGDVSSSVVRRVAVPNLIMSISAALGGAK